MSVNFSFWALNNFIMEHYFRHIIQITLQFVLVSNSYFIPAIKSIFHRPRYLVHSSFPRPSKCQSVTLCPLQPNHDPYHHLPISFANTPGWRLPRVPHSNTRYAIRSLIQPSVMRLCIVIHNHIHNPQSIPTVFLTISLTGPVSFSRAVSVCAHF